MSNRLSFHKIECIRAPVIIPLATKMQIVLFNEKLDFRPFLFFSSSRPLSLHRHRHRCHSRTATTKKVKKTTQNEERKNSSQMNRVVHVLSSYAIYPDAICNIGSDMRRRICCPVAADLFRYERHTHTHRSSSQRENQATGNDRPVLLMGWGE